MTISSVSGTPELPDSSKNQGEQLKSPQLDNKPSIWLEDTNNNGLDENDVQLAEGFKPTKEIQDYIQNFINAHRGNKISEFLQKTFDSGVSFFIEKMKMEERFENFTQNTRNEFDAFLTGTNSNSSVSDLGSEYAQFAAGAIQDYRNTKNTAFEEYYATKREYINQFNGFKKDGTNLIMNFKKETENIAGDFKKEKTREILNELKKDGCRGFVDIEGVGTILYRNGNYYINKPGEQPEKLTDATLNDYIEDAIKNNRNLSGLSEIYKQY